MSQTPLAASQQSHQDCVPIYQIWDQLYLKSLMCGMYFSKHWNIFASCISFINTSIGIRKWIRLATENHELLKCQFCFHWWHPQVVAITTYDGTGDDKVNKLCRHLWHSKLSLWQPVSHHWRQFSHHEGSRVSYIFSDYIHLEPWDVITHPCSDFIDGYKLNRHWC